MARLSWIHERLGTILLKTSPRRHSGGAAQDLSLIKKVDQTCLLTPKLTGTCCGSTVTSTSIVWRVLNHTKRSTTSQEWQLSRWKTIWPNTSNSCRKRCPQILLSSQRVGCFQPTHTILWITPKRRKSPWLLSWNQLIAVRAKESSSPERSRTFHVIVVR